MKIPPIALAGNTASAALSGSGDHPDVRRVTLYWGAGFHASAAKSTTKASRIVPDCCPELGHQGLEEFTRRALAAALPAVIKPFE